MVKASSKTIDYTAKPSAMLVALDDAAAELCKRLMPIDVMRVGHSRAACERMLVTRPLVIVIPAETHGLELGALVERAEDIGAELVQLAREEIDSELKARLADHVRRAWKRRLG